MSVFTTVQSPVRMTEREKLASLLQWLEVKIKTDPMPSRFVSQAAKVRLQLNSL